MLYRAMSYLSERECLAGKHIGFAVTLSFSAMLLMNFPSEVRSAEFELVAQNEGIIGLQQSKEMLRQTTKNDDRRATHTREGESNEQLVLTDRRDFEKVLLTDYPGTYLLYVKLDDQEKEKIFARYLQTGEIEIVREAVIDQVGR